MIGRVICKLRYRHGWTQDQLAVKMQVNGCDVSRDVVANIESARTEPTYQQIKFFARIFKVPVSTFFPPDLQKTGSKYPNGPRARAKESFLSKE